MWRLQKARKIYMHFPSKENLHAFSKQNLEPEQNINVRQHDETKERRPSITQTNPRHRNKEESRYILVTKRLEQSASYSRALRCTLPGALLWRPSLRTIHSVPIEKYRV